MPLVPGIIELEFMHGRSDDRTKRLAQLFKSYGKAVKNMLPTAQTPVTVEKPKTRTIVINQEIHSKTTVLPYDEVMKLIDETEYIAAGTCVCRHHGNLLDRPCDKPKDNLCMIFGLSAQFAQSYGFVNLISKGEARHENIFGSSLDNKTAVTDTDELSAKDILEEKDNSLPENLVKDYEERARAEQEAGATIEINERLPYIAIKMSDGSEYFFQDEEASMLLDEVPDNIRAKDFILAIAQGW